MKEVIILLIGVMKAVAASAGEIKTPEALAERFITVVNAKDNKEQGSWRVKSLILTIQTAKISKIQHLSRLKI